MAYQVVWSPKALEDVEAIAAYISRDSTSYAAAVVNKIIEATQNLHNLSKSNQPVPEFGDSNVREELAYSYRIIYRIKDEKITILAVIYGEK